MSKERYFYTAYASNCAYWIKLGVVATSKEKAIECFEKYLEDFEVNKIATDSSYGLKLVIKETKNNEPVEQKRRLHKVEFLKSGENG